MINFIVSERTYTKHGPGSMDHPMDPGPCFVYVRLRTYRTSVFPLSLYRNESSIGERTLYKTRFLIRIFRKTVRQEQIQDTKSTRKRTSVFTTELNERVHESKQCIPSLFTYIELKVPSGSFFGKIVFTSRTTRANLAYRTEG